MLSREQIKLIEDNINLAYWVANRWMRKTNKFDKDELISLSMLGLVKSVYYFNPDRGVKFSTYCTRSIDNEILMQIRKMRSRPDTIPASKVDIRKERANHLDTMDIFNDPDAPCKFKEVEDRHLIEELLMDLDQRERSMILLHYIEGYSRREVAGIYKLHNKTASKIITEAMKKLRKLVSG